MKANKKPLVNYVLKFAFLGTLFLTFSCSNETLLNPNESFESANAKYPLNSEIKVIARGANFHGANGIDIGPDGNLYVGSVIGLDITVMDKQNGKIIKRLGNEIGVKGPDDLVFGPDGSLYWTNILIGTVGRLQLDGTTSEQFVAPGVNPITFSPDGRLFVGLDFLGDGLYELDPNLILPPRPIVIASEANPFPLGFFNAFDFGTDGYLYGPLFAAGMVIKVNVDSNNPVSSDPFTDGVAQVVATGFKNPASAKFDPEGILNVLDQTGEVFKINTLTGEKTLFITLEPGLDNQVYDSDGTLYISNNDRGWVAEILPSGQPRYISPGGMIAPQGLAVLPGSNGQDALFVADQYNLRQLNGLSGKQENMYKAALIPDPNSLHTAENVAADGNNLLVSSWFSGMVQVFDPQANQILAEYVMAVPIDIVRFKDDVVVSDLGLGGVVWASDDSMILPIDNINVFAPAGLATDGETVWMADWGTGLVWQIGFDGKTPMEPIVIASGLSFPEGLAFEKEGSLVVVETGTSQLSRISLSTGEVTKVVDGLELSGPALEGYPPTWIFDGVAVGQTGDIYVSGGGTNVIYRVKKN
jgi:streptogramin lyase